MARKKIEQESVAAVPEVRVSKAAITRVPVLQLVNAKTGDAVFGTMQVPVDNDPFEGLYGENLLLVPPYSFESMWSRYETSDVLQTCIEAYIQNIDGFGYSMQFLGNDVTERDLPQALAEMKKMKSFFDNANTDQSWMAIRKLFRLDYEVLGNGGFEVIRNLRNEIALVYHMPFRYCRLTAMDRRGVTVDDTIERDGKIVNIKVKKYFRKFAQINPTTETNLRWFKEFGDPRIMDATTGRYVKSAKEAKIVASEILHFKMGGGGSAYGIPRWIGASLDVIGRKSAQYVNYDLFNNQGIPPVLISVSGGRLSDTSIAELQNMIRGMRGVDQWNKVVLLESEFESTGLEDKGNAKIEIKNLSDARREDLMFDQYLTKTEKSIRQRYRLSSLYTGNDEAFTQATAREARIVAEEQVFVPERLAFDEVLEKKVISKHLGISLWKYKTKGPQLVSASDLLAGISSFSQTGALTINNAIELANAAFNTDMSQYDEEWANFPIPIVLKLVEATRLKGIDNLMMPGEPVKGLPGRNPDNANQQKLPDKGKLPVVVKKMLRDAIEACEPTEDFTSEMREEALQALA